MMESFVSFSNWLISEKSLTTATWALVLATLFLYLDGRRKSGEQLARWKRDDEQRELSLKPSVVVELGKTAADPNVQLICYNMGATTFYIDEVIVKIGAMTLIANVVGPYVIMPGKFRTIPYDLSKYLTDNFQDAVVTLSLKSVKGLSHSEPIHFHLYPKTTDGTYDWGLGMLKERLPGSLVRLPRLIVSQVEPN